MTRQLGRSILVGVTGEDTAAVRFAIEEAGRDHCGVRLVHAVHQPLPPPPPSVLLSYEALADVGHDIVARAVQECEELAGGRVWIESEVRPGHPVRVLTELSQESRMVVLQHRDLARLTRIVTGSTATGVAAHAHCPVVSVPAAWSPDDSRGTVTVGVHETGTPRQVLDVAAAQADARDCRLRVLHAWHLDVAYDDIVVNRVGDWRVHGEQLLRSAVERIRGEHPQVEVEVDIRHQWPAEALVELSADSELLVLGRHGSHAPLPPRIGSMARTLIRESACPVMVVPVARGAEVAEVDWGLRADELQPQY